MADIIEQLEDIGKIELDPRMNGRRMTMIVGPDKRKIESYLRKQAKENPKPEKTEEASNKKAKSKPEKEPVMSEDQLGGAQSGEPLISEEQLKDVAAATPPETE